PPQNRPTTARTRRQARRKGRSSSCKPRSGFLLEFFEYVARLGRALRRDEQRVAVIPGEWIDRYTRGGKRAQHDSQEADAVQRCIDTELQPAARKCHRQTGALRSGERHYVGGARLVTH